MNEDNLIIYHSADFDGKFSRDVVETYLNDNQESFKSVGWNHNEKTIEIDRYKNVYIVDLPITCAQDFENNLGKITWIDHHAAVIEQYKDLKVKGLRRVGRGACELCFNYLFPHEELPKSLELVSSHDVWDLSEETENFQYGLRTIDEKYQNLWDSNGKIDEILDTGKTILKYQVAQNKILMKNARYIEFEGYKTICMNNSIGGSEIFDSIDPETYDIMLTYHNTKDNEWAYSVYSKKEIDVSIIARKFKGGGHYHAAGATLPYLLPELDNINRELKLKGTLD